MMSLKYGLLSLLLFFVVLLLVFKNYEIWTQPMKWVPEKKAAKKSDEKTERSPIIGGQKEPRSIQSYTLVAEKNIFSPERKEFPLPMVPAGSKKPSARPQVILYGVTIHGDDQYASVVNPGRALKKGEREMMTLKQGEQIGDYKLVRILPDRIKLEASGDSFEVLLYDPAMPKKRRSDVKTAGKKPAAITSTGSVSVPAPAEAPRPTPFPVPSPVPTERPRVPSQEAVSTPPLPVGQTPPPSSPSNIPTVYPGRNRRLPSPPVRTSPQQGGS
jgi:type II secretory pathway component PulC